MPLVAPIRMRDPILTRNALLHRTSLRIQDTSIWKHMSSNLSNTPTSNQEETRSSSTTELQCSMTTSRTTTTAEGTKAQKRKGTQGLGMSDLGVHSTPNYNQVLTPKTGTRSVSTLTPSQLARKRANDREAQRAIRARTKEHIERLEKELEELKGVKIQHEFLQRLVQRNNQLEQENRTLRRNRGLQPTPSPVYPSTRK